MVSEKRRPVDPLGEVDGAAGEEGATPRKRRGRPSGGEEAGGDWVTAGAGRRRSGRSPSLPSVQQSLHIQAPVMPAPPPSPCTFRLRSCLLLPHGCLAVGGGGS